MVKSIFNLPKKNRITIASIELILACIIIIGLENLSPYLRTTSWIFIFGFLLSIPLLLEKREGLCYGLILGAIRYLTKQSPPSFEYVINNFWLLESLIYIIIAFFFIGFIGFCGYVLGSLREIIIAKDLLITRLGEQHNKLDIILRAISEPLFVVRERDFKILYSNSKFEELAGESVDGKRCFDILENKKSPCENCPKPKMDDFDSKDSTFSWEKHSPGLQRDFLFVENPIRWEKNELARLIILIDITKQKELENEAIELAKKREIFIKITAHELRTPLTVFRLSLYYLINNLDLLDQEEIKKAFEALEKNYARLEVLVKNMGLLMDIHYGKLDLEPMNLNLKKLIETVLDKYKERIEIIGDINQETMLRGDRKYLQIAFSNILDNCIKYSPKNKQIEVLVESKVSSTIIRITDFGAGMSKDVINQLFQPYTSFDTQYSVGGTGIGLFISKQIFQAHQWELSAQSEGMGKGTTFIIEIPSTKISDV